jgi:hypothetical protein
MLDRAFGMDVHKDTMVIGKLAPDGTKDTRRFGVSQSEIQSAMDWLKKDNCLNGVMESTGIYWVPIYTQVQGSWIRCMRCERLSSESSTWKEI